MTDSCFVFWSLEGGIRRLHFGIYFIVNAVIQQAPDKKQTDFFSKETKIAIDVHFLYFNNINIIINI